MSEKVEPLNEVTKIGELGDEAKVGKMRDKDALAIEQEEHDIKAVMQTSEGRRFVATIIKDCGVGDIAYRESGRLTAFALGQQNFGHMLVAKLRTYCLELMRLMEDEDRDERKRN